MVGRPLAATACAPTRHTASEAAQAHAALTITRASPLPPPLPLPPRSTTARRSTLSRISFKPRAARAQAQQGPGAVAAWGAVGPLDAQAQQQQQPLPAGHEPGPGPGGPQLQGAVAVEAAGPEAEAAAARAAARAARRPPRLTGMVATGDGRLLLSTNVGRGTAQGVWGWLRVRGRRCGVGVRAGRLPRHDL